MDRQLQFRCGKTTLLLDGRVVEFFYEGVEDGKRFHVDHFAMDATPQDDGLKVRFGIRVHDRIVSGGKMEVAASQVPDFQAFVDAALAART